MSLKAKKPRSKSPFPYPKVNDDILPRPNKISETRTEYGVAPTATAHNFKRHAGLLAGEQPPQMLQSVKMDAGAAPQVAGIEIPEDVRRFAEKHGLFPHLETTIKLVHECFPSVNTLQLAYEVDWEIENESWVAVNIQVPGKVEQVLQQYLQFNRQMIQKIPSEKSGKILLGIGGLGS